MSDSSNVGVKLLLILELQSFESWEDMFGPKNGTFWYIVNGTFSAELYQK